MPPAILMPEAIVASGPPAGPPALNLVPSSVPEERLHTLPSLSSMLTELVFDSNHERWALVSAQIRHGGASLIGAPDGQYSMFREEDTVAWVVFSSIIGFFIIFDVFVLNRKRGKTTMRKAFAQTLFWFMCAVAFSFYVGHYRGLNVLSGTTTGGHDGAHDELLKSEYSSTASHVQQTWFNGYLLEWMLSYDNIFGFHMIFRVYGTPDELKADSLTYGIVGAILLRLVFLWVGEWAMHTLWAAHICFGLILVYTGVDGLIKGDEEEDPTENWMVRWLQKHLRLVAFYDKNGKFFVKVPIGEDGEVIMNSAGNSKGKHCKVLRNSPSRDSIISTVDSTTIDSARDSFADSESSNGRSIGRISNGSLDDFEDDSKKDSRENHVIDTVSAFSPASLAGKKVVRYEWRATLLFLVVCCLEITDLLFAIDSVSAIVAQISDLFLAYTSVIFAMLGIRATFFIIEVLAHVFSLLKYGVAFALIFIGLKLIASKVVHISAGVVCFVLFSIVILSMACSVIRDFYLHQGLYHWYHDTREDNDEDNCRHKKDHHSRDESQFLIDKYVPV